MKRILAEIIFELSAWLVLILGGIVMLFKAIGKKIIHIYKMKQEIKRRIREGAEEEIERYNELGELEKRAREKNID